MELSFRKEACDNDMAEDYEQPDWLKEVEKDSVDTLCPLQFKGGVSIMIIYSTKEMKIKYLSKDELLGELKIDL